MTDPRADFLARAGRGGMVPVVREVVLDADTPLAAFVKIARPPFGFLLESLVGGERWARYTFLGTEPREVWRYRDRRVERWTRETGWRAAGETDDPIGHLAQRMRALPAVDVPGLPRFTGGAVGYLGYDLVRTVERLPHPPPDTLNVPDAVLLIADTVVILDNLFGRAIVVANVEVPPGAAPAERLRRYDAAQARLSEIVDRLRAPHALAPLALPDDVPALPTGSRYPRAAFERDVAKILGYITAGDTFQTVLSRRQEVPGAVDPLRVYRYLRALNPAPYLFYLAFDDFALVGSSPEVLVRVEGGEVTVRPIAGTRPRGKTAEEDESLIAELRSDEKERAEHVMLVDLGRNDVGRIAKYGSVEVTELMIVERYSHVFHLVSQVEGELREGLTAMDALRATFPAGTMTGAPKVRAMEIIDELEPERRAAYAGAIGYIAAGAQRMDLAITIRTCVIANGVASVQAGAGIVHDSVPEREWEETENKARALLTAIGRVRENSRRSDSVERDRTDSTRGASSRVSTSV
jgi:anthranilate synthase component 1